MPRTVISACLVVVLLAAASAAEAQDTRNKILRECQDGALRGDYTAREIRDARNNIPDDIDQYSDCRDVLSRALQARVGGGGGGDAGGGAGGTGGGGGGGGPTLTPSTDADRLALEDAAGAGDDPVTVDGKKIVPGAAGFAADAARNSLPTTLVAVLVLLALAAALASAPFVRRRALGPLAGLGASLRRRVFSG